MGKTPQWRKEINTVQKYIERFPPPGYVAPPKKPTRARRVKAGGRK